MMKHWAEAETANAAETAGAEQANAGRAPERGAGVSRRGFLASGGAGSLAAALALAFGSRAWAEETAPAEAAKSEGAPAPKAPVDLPAREAANLELISQFCAAWATRDGAQVGAFFADNATFRMTEDAPAVQSRELITKRLQGFLAIAKKAEFVVLRSHGIGDIVINERFDNFTMGTKEVSYHMVGVFFVRGGKIQEWFDYRMPA